MMSPSTARDHAGQPGRDRAGAAADQERQEVITALARRLSWLEFVTHPVVKAHFGLHKLGAASDDEHRQRLVRLARAERSYMKGECA